MSTWGVTMVKDEIDVIEANLRHMATQVDGLLVADNGSTDGTFELVRDLHNSLDIPLTLIPDHDPAYYQARKMTDAARAVARSGATWVIPFDADEIWTHDSGRPIRVVLEEQSITPGAVIFARLWNYYTTAIDPPEVDHHHVGSARSPFERMEWRMGDCQPLSKVIVCWDDQMEISQGNHNATGGYELHLPGFEVSHFPYRSPEQFIRKAINGAAAYAATDLPFSMGQHWREYGLHYERGGEAALREIYETYFHYLSPSSAGLVHDPAKLG